MTMSTSIHLEILVCSSYNRKGKSGNDAACDNGLHEKQAIALCNGLLVMQSIESVSCE